jgi:hypothetical protein
MRDRGVADEKPIKCAVRSRGLAAPEATSLTLPLENEIHFDVVAAIRSRGKVPA